jgi:hypothetical protein
MINGTANLVAIDEIRAGLRPIDPRGSWALGQVGASVTWGHGIYGDADRPNSASRKSDDIVGCGRLREEVGQEYLAQERMTCCWYCESNEQATARSMHPGGVNTLTLDGAAHFVLDEIDPSVWHALHSRDFREEIPEAL